MYLMSYNHPLLSLHSNGHFPDVSFSRCICVGRYQNVSIPDFIGAKDDGGGDDNSYCSYKISKVPNCHHKQTNTQLFYRPDSLPVTQPTVSEH